MKKLLSILSLALIFASCSFLDSGKSAFDLNEELVQKENTLLPEITYTEDEIERFIEQENSKEAKRVSEEMIVKVETTISDVKNTELPKNAKGSEEFRDAFVRYFEGVKGIYVSYANMFSYDFDDPRFADEYQKFLEMAKNKNELIVDIRKAQSKYAAENNFRLESQTK